MGRHSSSLLKALKCSMAADFNRELGEEVFGGKARIVPLGFGVGAAAGYGCRRMMVSHDGERKQVSEYGEHRSLTTDA
jgi:hypothetical protein